MVTRLPNQSVEYIDSTDYKKLAFQLETLKSVLEDLAERSRASRKLRYADIDIEAEREGGRIAPDELYVPQHLIDTNIRREQSSYVQFVTQSPRAVILEDSLDPSVDLAILEKDLTKKLRFDGWQLSMYANIDNFQANGYGIMEVVYDKSLPGHLGHEMVQYGDFAFIQDTRDLQAVEMTARTYHYTRTQLIKLCDPKTQKNPDDVWDKVQVDKIIGRDDDQGSSNPDYSSSLLNARDRSLFRVHKIMFRVKGIVQVAWTCIGICDDWLRKPRDLFMGRREAVVENPVIAKLKQAIGAPPMTTEARETMYPYFLYPYLISENDTIGRLKGRIYLDQDTQEAVSSLLSSTVTQARRAAGMYFSQDVDDPNSNVLMDKNIFFRTGALINKKITAFNIAAPDPGIFSAIQLLVTGNQAETSQVNFAAQNRKDSRKTAAEIKAATQEGQQLSTVQVVLFSIALKQQYTYMCEIIKSRVNAGLIKVNPQVMPLYQRQWIVKPSGDTDVLEKKQMIEAMMQSWEVVQQTAAAPLFLADLLEKMFPDSAQKYLNAIQQAQQQQQSQQSQMMQQMMGQAIQIAQGIIKLSKEPQMFSDMGRIHALPIVEHTADQLEALMKQMQPQGPKQ